jgi:predicted nucleic acid-binding protein
MILADANLLLCANDEASPHHAVEHGAVLCTTDRDFTRFPALKILDPLKSKASVPSQKT